MSAKLHVGGTPERPVLAGDVDAGRTSCARGVAARRRAPDARARGEWSGPAPASPGVSIVGRALRPLSRRRRRRRCGRAARRARPRRLPAHRARGAGARAGGVRRRPGHRQRAASPIDLAPGQPLAVDVLLPELCAVDRARRRRAPTARRPCSASASRRRRPVHVAVAGDHVELDKVTLRHRRRRPAARRAASTAQAHLAGAMSRPPGPRAPAAVAGRGGVEQLSAAISRSSSSAAGTLDKPDPARRRSRSSTPITVRPHGLRHATSRSARGVVRARQRRRLASTTWP